MKSRYEELRMRRSILFLLMVLILGIGFRTSALAQCSYNGEGCSGYCAPLYHCVSTGYNSCTCEFGSDAPGPICRAKSIEMMPTEVFASKLSDAKGGKDLLEVGNGITLVQTQGMDVEVRHSTAWGGGVQQFTIPADTLTVGIHLTGVDTQSVNRRTFVVDSVGMVLPSFASIALGGGMTGDNVVSADEKRSGAGWVDTSTGVFHVQLYLELSNGVFQLAPALVQASLDGTIDTETGVVTIDSPGKNYQVIASSPDTTLW